MLVKKESPEPSDQQHSSSLPGFPYAIQQPTLNEARSESDATRTSTGGQKLYNKEKTDNDGTADHDGHVNYVGLGL